MNPLLLEKFKDEIRPNIKSSTKQPPWMDSFFYSTSDPYTFLDLELIDFAKWIQPTLEEKYVRLRIYKNIQECITKIYPLAKVILFGSNSTDSNLPFSDIDLSVVIKNLIIDDTLEELYFIGRYLKLSGVISQFQVINAKVPIVKATDSGFRLPIDIGIVTQLSDEDNDLNYLAYMERNRNALSRYPSMYPVLMYLKMLLCQEKLEVNYEGGISSTLLFNMLLSVCQINESTTKFSPSKLLLNFLWYYGDIFNPMQCTIGVANGGYLIKNDNSDIDNTPKFSFIDPVTGNASHFRGTEHFKFIKKCRAWNEKLRIELQYPCRSKLDKLLDMNYIFSLNTERIVLKKLFQTDQEQQNKNSENQRWNVVANFIMAQTNAIVAKRNMQKSNLPTPGKYKETLKVKLTKLDKYNQNSKPKEVY
ncbi:Nucleotidyltransferase domain containing protein [Trichomonas vaginalis G3]|uniref:Nucleotidyltransferase domain containing protein n=1 Tax=Trichomonas vaginalis (strain ATCC PRA-98 / G3) TaxID=412133 RepID=A2DSJ4_TRIV3|nr:polynucleotide adenylyltransferase protein [Trichomonas vaginalis G3]EAY16574.1 Nucleotidyltransferase domain containing protein [Trichomonas vaginalis G3]KAI5532944.1 polynucleotide adenylyltransferase protein [Trichomonas vaginalis G3]|eukprot:XP_001328797.1 Nucleotidyltransferase domain containing protein [Trichomonas vaginalis G3]